MWQPIESAPKDGTRVDVWVEGYSDEPRRYTEAWFSDGHWWYADDSLESEVWSFDGGDYLKADAVVTHWMPLPEPPKEEAGAETPASV